MRRSAKQDEFTALTELRNRRLTGRRDVIISPETSHHLQILRLGDLDQFGDLNINARGEQHLKRLARLGLAKTIKARGNH